ncbi:MAG: hypothetical protein GQ564_09960 [Bacteroidales bacterium]|nr:hypothetical protein [Bacteroidales bacterium]
MTRRHFITLFISVLISLNTFGDTDSCVKFEVELTLENDSIIKAFYVHYGMYLGYLDFLSFDDICQARMRTPKENDTLIFYKQLDKLKYSDNKEATFYACTKDDIIKVALDDISAITHVVKEPCFPEIEPLNKYHSCGFWPVVITELDKKEIERIKTEKPKHGFTYLNNYFDRGFSYLMIISYNENLNIEAIKEKLAEDINQNLKGVEVNNSEWTEYYLKLQAEFARKDILLLKIFYYN